MSRLKEQYQNEIVDAMIKKFGYKNIMEVPKLDKIVVNMGVGEAKENAKLLEAAIKDMETITGQKAVPTKAKNAIANYCHSYFKSCEPYHCSRHGCCTDKGKAESGAHSATEDTCADC